MALGEKPGNNPETPVHAPESIRRIQRDEFDFILKSKKSRLAETYLKNKEWLPLYVLKLNDWKTWWLSKIIKWSAHKYIVWYCFVKWELKLRLFWRSNSEWCRRAWLWEDWYGVISKWQNIKNATYETTTKIDYRISRELDKISTEIIANSRIHPIFGPIDGSKVGNILNNEMVKEIKIDKLYEKYPYTSSCWIIAWKNINTTKQWYKNINLRWINLDSMKPKENWIYSYQHKYLWTIDVQICEIDWNGTPINIHFARSRNNHPEKIWIDNMTYPNARINSFWTHDRQINAAPLTAKPIEYTSQAPKNMTLNHQVFGHYVDIRDLYQENPIIIKYKERFWKFFYKK